MKSFIVFLLSSLTSAGHLSAFSFTTTTKQQQFTKHQLSLTSSNNHDGLSRRSVLNKIAAATLALTTTTTTTTIGIIKTPPAVAAPQQDEEYVYFGVGCFWHIQHEFVEAEKALLGRTNPSTYTSLVGYAGGTTTGENGKVCYHNTNKIADYGKLGHAEVVGMKLPTDKIVDFSQVYFSLFDPKTKDRVDPLDKGPEYRNLIGLPGGTKHPVYSGIETAAKNAGFRLVGGKGNDPDTLGTQIVYVYDTAQFPFYQGEVYHQYHNDFQSPPYGKAYNKLRDQAFEEGRLEITGCPDLVRGEIINYG